MGGRGSGSGRSGGGAGARPTGPVRLDTMNDAQLSSFVQQALGAQLPPGFHDDPTQRLIVAAQWNGQPEIVTASQAEALARKRGAVALYRTVNDNPTTSQSSQQIADGFRTDTTFSTGGWGGQVYGGGVYFSDNLAGSKAYGRQRYGGNPPTTMGAVLNDKAKVVSDTQLTGPMGAKWVKSHPRAAQSLGVSLHPQYSDRVRASSGARTAMAMAMGFNVVKNESSGSRAREHYYTVLDRSALTTSTKDYYPQRKGMKGR